MTQQIGYTIAQAALQVGLSERSIRDAIKDSHLPARFFKTKALVDHDDLKEWFKKLPSDSPK